MRTRQTTTAGAAVLIALLMTACGAAPLTTAPSPPPATVPQPLAFAGQSNAWLMWPTMEQAYAPGRVVGFAQEGSYIRQWDEGTDFWNRLAPQLHQPLRAFVWWQGESDRHPGMVEIYGVKLQALVARVRYEAADPQLLVVICRVVNDPAFAGIRAAQEAYVATDPRAVLVSSDGLPLESAGSAHLSADGYREMAQRVLRALERRE